MQQANVLDIAFSAMSTADPRAPMPSNTDTSGSIMADWNCQSFLVGFWFFVLTCLYQRPFYQLLLLMILYDIGGGYVMNLNFYIVHRCKELWYGPTYKKEERVYSGLILLMAAAANTITLFVTQYLFKLHSNCN